jgi:O-antigen/teichoic acid export membrane protein
MNVRRLIGNFGVAALAQGASMVISTLVTLFVPKMLGVEQFGYWQLFIFYIGYVGFFMFGLNDGVYLINGGKTFETVDRKSLASQFLVALVMNFVCGAVIVATSCALGQERERELVIFMTGVYLVISNTAAFLGYVFQALDETKLYSISCILDKGLFLGPLIALIALRVKHFEPYVACYTLSRLASLCFCLYKAKGLMSPTLLAPHEALRVAWESMKVGIKLTIANIASLFIIGVARFVADGAWGIEAFGQLSFALTLENFFITFVTQLSMVLFPALRQADTSEQVSAYTKMQEILALVLPAVYVLYYPIQLLVMWWLPSYGDAVSYLVYLLPVCVFECKMNLLGTTYLKVLRMERELLIINLTAVAISIVGSLFSAYVCDSLVLLMGAVVLSITLRSIVSECVVERRMGLQHSKLSSYAVVSSVIFISSFNLFIPEAAFVTQVLVYTSFLYVNRRKLGAAYKLLLRVCFRNQKSRV